MLQRYSYAYCGKLTGRLMIRVSPSTST